MNNIKYTFMPLSIKGLTEEVVIYAQNYVEAKHKLLKCIYLGKTGKHLEECVKQNPWPTLGEIS